MALRSMWEGFLRLSLISVPVKAYTATAGGSSKLEFHQLHKECQSRIRYQKVCPIHGEVSKDDIVLGYEYAKGEYVVLDPEELAKLRPGADKTINIEVFIDPHQLLPIYLTDRTYYLAPDGKSGEKPYAILHKIMAEENRAAIATMIFSGRDHLVLIRPIQKVLAATVLSYATQIRPPSVLDDDIPDPKLSGQELKLARTLVEESTAEKFDFSAYTDSYTEKVMQLIDAKVSGQKLVTPPSPEEPHVINLMDALKRSLKSIKGKGEAAAKEKRRTSSRRRTG